MTPHCTTLMKAYGNEYIRDTCLPNTGQNAQPIFMAGAILLLLGVLIALLLIKRA